MFGCLVCLTSLFGCFTFILHLFVALLYCFPLVWLAFSIFPPLSGSPRFPYGLSPSFPALPAGCAGYPGAVFHVGVRLSTAPASAPGSLSFALPVLRAPPASLLSALLHSPAPAPGTVVLLHPAGPLAGGCPPGGWFQRFSATLEPSSATATPGLALFPRNPLLPVPPSPQPKRAAPTAAPHLPVSACTLRLFAF